MISEFETWKQLWIRTIVSSSRDQIIRAVCDRGDSDALKWFWSNTIINSYRDQIIRAVCDRGDSDALKWFWSNTIINSYRDQIIRAVCDRGDSDALKWFLDRTSISSYRGRLIEAMLKPKNREAQKKNTILELTSNQNKRSKRFHSCFISYGNPDERFAKKLHEDLSARGVSCWLYVLDYKAGEHTWREITSKRKSAEKIIVLCSLRSLIRPGMKRELQEQIAEDENKIIPISLDSDWTLTSFEVKTETMNVKPYLIDRNYIDFSEELQYNEKLEILIEVLRID